ncbi:hypothetical protein E2562_014793 [Oryza meyeriana var. granulata]|uniref:HMA domain-containing protein n=1 Tax=Oryza meyeriana var. granulata TaxID=110450 RepID=A0A6G1BW51_9ORYZ|nr:hypothetical protein E2562_014793 [Oryza meyeriana var. granulata]
MGETKAELMTAVYKVHVHCKQCAHTIVTQFTQFPGVREVKLDGGKVTVKGIGFDAEKLRKKVEKGCRRRVELVPPPKDIVTEVKSKKESVQSGSERFYLSTRVISLAGQFLLSNPIDQ